MTAPAPPLDAPIRRPPPARRSPWLLGVPLLVGVVLVVTGTYVPYLTPAAGMAALFGVPAYIVVTTTDWRAIPWRERLVLAACAGIGLPLLVGLVLDVAGPLVGIGRPLDRVPLLVVTGVAWWGLWLRRRDRWTPLAPVLRAAVVGRRDVALVGVAALAVLAAVVGADRLNNDAGSGAAVVAQVLVVAVLAATLAWRRRIAGGTIPVVVYGAGLALLLQTSLRGWFVSGHDIQHEFYVFTQTARAGHWAFGQGTDPYNACLSITILPTMVLHLTGVDAPYVYKVCFQLLFALSGVVAYAIASRLLGRGAALVATIFFVSFPTFFTDMPFLNRQEIAFLFCGCCFLLFVADELPLHRRRAWMLALVAATIVTHYSTSYLLIGVLVIAKLLEVATRWRPERYRVRVPRAPVSAFILAFAVVLTLAWGSGSAQSDRHLADTLGGVVSSLAGSTASTRDASTSYSLFGGTTPSSQQLIREYVHSTLPSSPAARAAAERVAAAYPARAAPTVNLPTTALGRALGDVGLSPATVNDLVRSLAARLLQVFALVGLVAVVGLRRHRASIRPDMYFLALGSLVMVGLQVVLPNISVDYGLLRAFQQALLVLAPFVTIGCLALARAAGRRVAPALTGAVALTLLTSLIGLMPQELGGYPAQLTLDNRGQYYDLYYVSAEEVAAARWLGGHAPPGSAVAADATTATILSNYLTLPYSGDIWPTLLVRTGPYVFLDRAEVRLHDETVSPSGTSVAVVYPIAYLDRTHDLVYASPDDRIYH